MKHKASRLFGAGRCILPLGAALSVALVISVLGAVKGQAAEDYSLAGTWLIQPHSAPGIATVRTVTFRLAAKGIEGVWTDWNSHKSIDRPLTNINSQGGVVSFLVTYAGEGFEGGGAATDKWSGEFSGTDHLKMTLLAPDGAPYQTLVFERVSVKELEWVKAKTPKILFAGTAPLPALRDVPSNGLALLPIVGWNSWNLFAEAVDDRAIRETADSLVSSGLRDAGYVYLTIDDGWQGSRDAQGVLHPNKKFPDMKALADYIHSKGLRFGIYSSPGMVTCGGYLGSYGYERQDAQMFAAWGADLLKYDWCSALEIYTTRAQMQAVFQKMGEALRDTGRPIVYSVDDYGWFNVGKWGRNVGGNLWRSGGDSVLGGRWGIVSSRFESDGDPDDNGPNGWNDPDIMLIGNGGLTVDESRSHMTLWVMLAAPLIIGNDVRTTTPEVASILLNLDVIAVDQDRLGKQGRMVLKKDSVEVWTKPLSDGSTAVAIFNRGTGSATVDVHWKDIGLGEVAHVRDLWARANLGELSGAYTTAISPHGSALLKVATAQ